MRCPYPFVLIMMFVGSSPSFGQDLFKELSKLDPNSVTATVDAYGKRHASELVKAHEQQLADLEKAGVQILKNDVTLTVDKPTKIAFGWPCSSGQKLFDKSNIQRSPYVITLYPTKDITGKDAPQKWQISLKDGTIKATE